MSDIRDRLRDFWEKQKLSQSQIAADTGITRQTISNIINTQGYVPGADLLAKISGAYPSLDMQWVLTGRASQVDNGKIIPKKFIEEEIEELKNEVFQLKKKMAEMDTFTLRPDQEINPAVTLNLNKRKKEA